MGATVMRDLLNRVRAWLRAQRLEMNRRDYKAGFIHGAGSVAYAAEHEGGAHQKAALLHLYAERYPRKSPFDLGVQAGVQFVTERLKP